MSKLNCIRTSQLSPHGAEALGAGAVIVGNPDKEAGRAHDRERIDRFLAAIREMDSSDTLFGVLQAVDPAAAAEHAVTIRTHVERDVQPQVAAYAAELTTQLLAQEGFVAPDATQPPSHLPGL